jgi:hypothetical protein
MNQPTTYALGLFHGGLIIGFVWIMFPQYREKVKFPLVSPSQGERRGQTLSGWPNKQKRKDTHI